MTRRTDPALEATVSMLRRETGGDRLTVLALLADRANRAMARADDLEEFAQLAEASRRIIAEIDRCLGAPVGA